MGEEPKVHIVTNWLQCLCWFKLVKKTTISNIQSLLTSGTTHTSKYGIFRFENTAEALGGADGETNLQDSGDDHSDSGHFCRQSGAWPPDDFTVSALATMNHVLLPIHLNDLSTWTHPCVVQRSAPSGRALAMQQSPASPRLVKGRSNFKTHTCRCSFSSGSVLYL